LKGKCSGLKDLTLKIKGREKNEMGEKKKNVVAGFPVTGNELFKINYYCNKT
jgi:hypothetical protein